MSNFSLDPNLLVNSNEVPTKQRWQLWLRAFDGYNFTTFAPRRMRCLPLRWLVPIFSTLLLPGRLSMGCCILIKSRPGSLICCQAANVILAPALSTDINERSPEKQRATVLSLQTNLFSATMIVLFPLFGLGVSNIAYGTVYLWTMAALIICSLAILGTVWIRNRRIEQ